VRNSVIFGRRAGAELSAKYPDRFTVVHWLEGPVQGLPSAAALAGLAAPVSRPRRLHLRTRTVHGGRRGGAEEFGARRTNGLHIEVFKSFGVPEPGSRAVRDRGRTTAMRGQPPRSVTLVRANATRLLRGPRNAKLLDVLARQGTRRAVLLPRRPLRRMRCAEEGPETSRWEVLYDVARARRDLDEGLILGCHGPAVRSDSVEVHLRTNNEPIPS